MTGPLDKYPLNQTAFRARIQEKSREILRYASSCGVDTVILPPYDYSKGRPMREVASIIGDILFPIKRGLEQFPSLKKVVIAVAKDTNDQSPWINFRDVLSGPARNDAGQSSSEKNYVDILLSRSILFMVADVVKQATEHDDNIDTA